MRRYWWAFGIVAVLSGLYHGIMTGYLTQRAIAMTIRHGLRQPTVEDQYKDMRSLASAIDGHDRRSATLRSITPDSSADGIEEARTAVKEQLDALEPALGREDDGDADTHAAFDGAARFFRDWEPPSMNCLAPKAKLWSSIIFGISFCLALLSSLVRVFAGPEG